MPIPKELKDRLYPIGILSTDKEERTVVIRALAQTFHRFRDISLLFTSL